MKIVRWRSAAYRAFIRSKPCLVCGRPAECHHIQYGQPRAMAAKSGDEWGVPICVDHHRDIHRSGIPERTWWALHGINPLVWAEMTFEKWKEDNGYGNDPPYD